MPTRHWIAAVFIALVYADTSFASDWRSELKQELKAARESAREFDPKNIQGAEVHARLRYDRALYAKVKQRCEGKVVAINNASDGTAAVTFGTLREQKYELFGGPPYPQDGTAADDEPLISGTATLFWKSRDRPLPLAIGMSVYLGIDSEKTVRAFSYHISRTIAVRKRADGYWEELVQVAKDNDSKQPLLVLFANRTDLDGTPTDCQGCGGFPDLSVEWNEPLGLCKGYWGDCGGGELEPEGISSKLGTRGWAPANLPKTRILPGRNGWTQFDHEMSGKGNELVPAAQYLQDSC